MSQRFIEGGVALVAKATAEDAAGRFAEALPLYEAALDHFLAALKCLFSPLSPGNRD